MNVTKNKIYELGQKKTQLGIVVIQYNTGGEWKRSRKEKKE